MSNTNASGEVLITMCDKEYTLRPTLDVIRKLDARNMKLLPLINRLRTMDFGLSDMALLIWAGVNAAGTKLSIAEVEDLVFRTGFANKVLMDGIADFVTNLLSGGRPPKPAEEGEGEGEADPT